MLGSDRITIDNTRAQPLWLNGAPVTLLSGQFLPLAGGTIYNRDGTYLAVAKTGEEIRVRGVSTTVFLGDNTKDVSGLLGNANGNAANDLALPNGTILTGPLTFDELYGTFANDWRVTDATSLFDYPLGDNTASYTNLNFPPAPVQVSSLPPDLVAQAQQYVDGLGITNLVDQQNAILDYILAGAGAAQNDAAATQGDTSTSSITPTGGPVIPYLGITGEGGTITVGGGSHQATFSVFLTAPARGDVVVDYRVLAGTGDGVTAADYGGILPSGEITLAPGSTLANITINVPGSLALPDEVLTLFITTASEGVTQANADSTVDLHSGVPVKGIDAAPLLYLPGSADATAQLSGSGTNYVFNIGTLGGNGIAPLLLELENNVPGYGDTLAGSFALASGSGFNFGGLGAISGLVGGQLDGIYVTLGTSLGSHTETIILHPTSSNETGYASDLPAVTLTIEDTVVAPTARPGPVASVIDVVGRVGFAFGAAVTVANDAPIGSDKLGVALLDTGGHVLPVQTENLAPGATSALSLNNPNKTAGIFTDTLSIGYSSMPPVGATESLSGTSVVLHGTVFQPASIGVATTLHFGSVLAGFADTIALPISNLLAAGSLSDTLIAIADGVTLTIAPGHSANLDLTIQAGGPGVVDDLQNITFVTHDSAQADAVLGVETIHLDGTIISNAVPEFTASAGVFSGQATSDAVLNLGVLNASGTAYDFALGVANDGIAGADSLGGTVMLVRNGVTSALGTFSGLASGLTHVLGTLGITPSTIGAFTETIILDPTDSGLGALPARTLTVEATVVGTPVLTAPGTATLTTGGTLAIGGVSLAETGNFAGETFTVQLAATSGTLFAAGAGVSGSGTQNLSIEGSLAQVNAALATLKDAESAPGTDHISLAAVDSLGEIGGFATIAVTVSPVALVPKLTAPATLDLGIGKTLAIGGVTLAEPGNTLGEMFTVHLTDTHGLLSATGTGVAGSGTQALTLTGSAAQLNADLATLKDADATAGPDMISLAVTDSFGNTAAAAIAVMANGLPVITAPATATLGLGQPKAITGVTVTESGVAETFTLRLSDSTGLLSATGTGISGSGSKTLTLSGTAAQVNADLATLKDVDATAGADTISLGVTDSLGNTAAAAIAVTVNGLPAITAPASATVSLTQPTAISGVSLSESGTTTGEIFTVKLGDSNGLLAATGAGITGSGSKALTLSGSLAQVNADLATLTDTDTTAGADKITLAATDGLGNVAAGTISVAASSNLVPVFTAPTTKTLGLGRPAAISGVSLAETGSTGGESFTVRLSDASGLLSATGAGVSGAGSTALTISGSLAQVNADLATLQDTAHTAGADTITLTATDSFGGKASSEIAVAVDGLPIITAPATAVFGQGHSAAIAGVSIAESGAGATFTVHLTDATGLLSATGAGVSGAGTKALTISGSSAQVNADLATLRDASANAGTESITLGVTDSFGNTAAAAIAVTVNGPPVITAPATVTVATGMSTSITGLSLSESGTTGGEIFTIVLADTNGILSATGAGVAGAGTKALTISGALAQVNADLATLKDVDATSGPDKITLNTTDSFGNAAAGTVSVSAGSTLKPMVSAPPAATLGVSRSTAITGISLAEPGSTPGESFTVKLSDATGLLTATGAGVAGAGTRALTITGSLAQVNADLATLKDLDATAGPDEITLGVTDSLGNTGSASIAVTVNGLPVITAPATAAVSTRTPTSISGVSLSESGTNTDEIFTVRLSDGNGLLAATGLGITGSGTRTLTVSGSLAQVNGDLATLKDLDATAGPDMITLAATDSLGNSGTGKTIAVTASSAATGKPVLTAPASKTLTAGTATAIAGVSLAETPAAIGETFTVRLTDSYGMLSATGPGVTGSGSKLLTITGSLAAVNADLATLKDDDLTAGADKIILSGTDSTGAIATGATIAVTASGTVSSGTPVIVGAGTTASNLTIGNGGSELLTAGGTANNTTITAGGTQGVLPGATTNNTVIKGGVAGVAGTANNTQVDSGGTEVVGLGGNSVGTVIRSGGTEYALYNGTATNTTIDAGGTLIDGPGGKIAGGVTFAGSDAVLSLAGKTLPIAPLSGFDLNGATDDAIILTGFTYAAGHDSATLGAGNLLTLDLNGTFEKLMINPSENYAGHSFSVVTNSLHQVVVIDPATGSAPRMDFLAPATAAGSDNVVGQILGRSAGWFLAIEDNRTAAGVLPALQAFGAIGSLNVEGAAIATLGPPASFLSMAAKLLAHSG
jgi:autotransporter passenger strand-loop-strand repeat protein